MILAGPADQSQRRSSRRKAASCFVALPELFEGQHAKKKHGKNMEKPYLMFKNVSKAMVSCRCSLLSIDAMIFEKIAIVLRRGFPWKAAQVGREQLHHRGSQGWNLKAAQPEHISKHAMILLR